MYVYILYSAARGRYYIGETQNVEQRLMQHRTGFFRASSTANTTDWELVIAIPCADRIIARALEAFLKRQRNRQFLERFMLDEAYRKKLLFDRFVIEQ
jgi:putative endonuclease